MGTLDTTLIKQKVEHILAYVDELKPLSRMSYEDFVKDIRNVRTAERDLQLMVDTAVDINNHIIIAGGSTPPNDYFESFTKLSEQGVLSKDFAERIAQSAGLRNRLVHEYEEINLSILFRDLGSDIKDYIQYCKQVIKYLETQFKD